jgi:hemerythrin
MSATTRWPYNDRVKPSDIRIELLRQHEDLRARMRVLRAVTERCLAGEDGHAELRRLLTALTDAVRAHNAREEQLMSKVFPDLDAWGPVRHDVMNEEHIQEHEKLVNALVDMYAESDPKASARVVLTLFDEMTQHMEREEKAFLGENVLDDDEKPPDAFGG